MTPLRWFSRKNESLRGALRWKQPSVVPGFGLAFGYATAYLSLLVLIPLAGLAAKAASVSPGEFWRIATDPRAVAAYRLTFGAAFLAAGANAVFGLIVAWTLVRYEFPGRRLLDALVDLPFALPTAVAGIALTELYAPNGWLGKPLHALGVPSAYSPLGVGIALTFIGLPFVVRTAQPVLEELEKEAEEAAASLGATRAYALRRVVLPTIFPALLTGFALAFARALGEYGSVVFISGNMPMKTEIASLLIVVKLEQFDYAGAAVLATVTLAASFALLLLINGIQRWSRRHQAA